MRVECGHEALRIESKSSSDLRLLLERLDPVTVVKIKADRAGKLAQLIEYLSSMHKALGSILNTV